MGGDKVGDVCANVDGNDEVPQEDGFYRSRMSVMDLGRGVQAPQIDSSNFEVRRVCSSVWASSENRQI